jgi:cob(I)alamin adenosyltransferase
VAIGEVDELNSTLGVLIAHVSDTDLLRFLSEIQHHLFDLGGELAYPAQLKITEVYIEALEAKANAYNADMPELKEFILPGGSKAASFCHVARSVCRRAERAVVALGHAEDINPLLLAYTNRLSDFLFIASRVLNKLDGVDEVYWKNLKN